eukprot:snap_masked-scaffold_80-processed-gene-0.3-mRNA-1 protein AED:1.00 eAED:1.00 QI:0/0/0/0/1/1/3/0/177
MVNGFIKAQRYAQINIPSATWLKLPLLMHREVEEWTITGQLSDTYETLVSISENLDQKIYNIWSKSISSDSGYIKIAVLTPGAKWLDIVELKLKNKDEVTLVTADSYSTGFLPLSIPLAPLLNIAFCWFPFRDRNGQCQKWLMAIRENEKVLTKLTKVDRIRISIGNPRKGPIELQK